MPLQNKMDPFGAITAEPMRGLFMGNRGGRIHDPLTRTILPGKTHASRQWITCLTQFKCRKRTLMGEGSYTELFFLDEVVSLAAGHRPCAECRRADYRRFCSAIDGAPVKASDLDRRLHGERLGLRPTVSTVGELPDGAMIAVGGTAYAKRGNEALPFTFAGYGEPVAWETVNNPDAPVLTPATTILALQNGYEPLWHPSAGT